IKPRRLPMNRNVGQASRLPPSATPTERNRSRWRARRAGGTPALRRARSGSWSQCMHERVSSLSHPRQMRNPGDMFIAAAVLLPRGRMARDANGVCATRCRVRSLLCGLVLALGCAGCGRPESSSPAPHRAPPGPVTFDRDIAPITFQHCSPCHRPGQSGPFDLLTYADVRKRAREIGRVTLDHTMPPWLPEPGYGQFKEERRLSEEEIRLIQEWIVGGEVEGNSADLPPVPQWSESWQLGEPDLVLKIPEPYTLPESGRDV